MVARLLPLIDTHVWFGFRACVIERRGGAPPARRRYNNNNKGRKRARGREQQQQQQQQQQRQPRPDMKGASRLESRTWMTRAATILVLLAAAAFEVESKCAKATCGGIAASGLCSCAAECVNQVWFGLVWLGLAEA